MSNQNYTILSNKELFLEIKSRNIYIGRLKNFLKRHDIILYNEIIERTKFLPNDITIKARMYCLEHDLHECPKCHNPNCINHVTWSENNFSIYCSPRCRQTDPDHINKLKQIFIEKYGVDSPFKSQQVQDKSKQTCLSRYGVEFPIQLEDVKQKIKQTCIEKYGSTNIFNSDTFKQMCIERYGVENPQQSDEIKCKIKQTNIDRYGVECTLQSSDVREKAKKTCIEKYGVEYPSQSHEVLNKIKQTSVERYGCESPLSNKEVRKQISKTCMEKYGVDCALKSKELRDKGIATLLKKYGVTNFSYSDEFASNSHKPYVNSKYPDMTFGSSWEFKVYDFLKEHNINFEYQCKPIPYEYDGKTYHYIPDFKVGDKIYEVKGDHFFRINESGKEEMYCPYRYPEWTDEHYEWVCGKFEAKHQCMISNEVKILRESDINNLNIGNFA